MAWNTRPVPTGTVNGKKAPYSPYKGFDEDDFSTERLEDVFEDAEDLANLGRETFEEYNKYAQETYKDLADQLTFLKDQGSDFKDLIIKEGSVVEKQAKNDLERNLKQQASLAATFGGGSAGRAQSQLLAQAAQQNQETSASSSALRLQEDISRKQLHISAQQNQSQLINQVLDKKSSVAETGLQAGTNLVVTGEKNKLGSAGAIADIGLAKQNIFKDVHAEKKRIEAEKEAAKKARKGQLLSGVFGAIGATAGFLATGGNPIGAAAGAKAGSSFGSGLA